jgi:hypothetical protein
MHLFHITPNHPRARHPSHSFILALLVVEAPRFQVLKGKDTCQLFLEEIFPGMAPCISSIMDSLYYESFGWLRIA